MSGASAGSMVISSEHLGIDIAGRCVLDHVDLKIPSGSMMGLLGQNGAGKSTLLSAMAGLLPYQRGRMVVLGQPAGAMDPAIRSQLGIIPQETSLYDELTARENLEFASALFCAGRNGTRIGDLLDQLGLSPQANIRAGRLSGGQRRRIVIARALVHGPSLLLIDEPTLGVDAEARESIWSLVRKLRSLGTSVVVASNYLDEIQALCDEVLVLGGGRVLATATIPDLMERVGCTLEVVCSAASRISLSSELAGSPEVSSRCDTASGMLLSCKGRRVPPGLIRRILELAPDATLHTRTPDLAAIFRSLGSPAT
jgi:ABC-2 type transport system ATP-binding protein